tara:strand:- start:14345 stop:14905 length:561 start_codon:yes stop_codon:yes gene_type:complete
MDIPLNSIIDKKIHLYEGEYYIKWHVLSIPLLIWNNEIPEAPGFYGLYNANTIQVSLSEIYKSHDYMLNRLTVQGVVLHEFCHVLQYSSNLAFEPGWFNLYENSHLEYLYHKYTEDFKGFYASKNPQEACAEVFRSLLEVKNKDEKWENNTALLLDYILFFEKEKFFKEFVVDKFVYIRNFHNRFK